MPSGLTMAAAVALAWLVDASFGEPSNAWHPVAWLGRVLGPIGRVASRWRAVAAFVAGAGLWLVIAALLAWATWCVQRAFVQVHPLLAVVVLALLLKPCFAWRMLRDEVRAVDRALAVSLDDGRRRVGRLCSRDVTAMDADGIRETAIETLAENLNDSVVAPLFWFAVGGLPAAVVYRFANTADAMWGYRGRYEWFGKWSARADDVLSWAPARLTAASLMLCGPRPFARGLAVESARTPSPNGGWPMGAMALALRVRLRKPGVYALNATAPSPTSADLESAVVLATHAAWTAVASTLAAAVARAAWP